MEIEKRFTISDTLVTIACLIGFMYYVSLFNGVLNQSLDKINEQPIGTITFKYKSAQRKLIDRVLWDRVKQNSPVYNGDIIRTAELSEATITFVDGNVIDLYEQSLAQVFLDLEEGTAIDFSGGGVSIDTSLSANGITLSSGSANVQVSKGSVLSAVAPTVATASTLNQLSLQMTSGEAQILQENGEQGLSLSEGSSLVFDEQTGGFIPPSLSVVTPASNVKYLAQGQTANIPFLWEKENIESNEYIILETSRKRDFSEVVEQISFTNVNAISLNMDEGIWYWRVYTQSFSSMVTGTIQVFSVPAPNAIVPANASEFTYRTKAPQVRFMWNDDEYARSWLFEVADNEAMQNPLISQITNQPSIIVNTLDGGRYYWNIKPAYSTSFLGQDSFATTESKVNYFDVIEQGELTKAELVLPLEGGFIDANNAQEGHHFSWKYDYEASDYTILISENRDLSSPVVEQTIDENYYIVYPDVANISEGTWYWAVTKNDSEGSKSEQSDVRTVFSVEGKVEQRTLFPPDGYSVAENLIIDTTFTWKTNLPFAMKFQIARNEDFSDIFIEDILRTTSVSGFSIPVGTWYWRIIADSAETTVPYKTEPKMFTVSTYLEKVFVSDVSAELPVVVRPSVPMEFSWEEVSSADYYQVRLYNTSDRTLPVYENLLVEGNSINIDMEDFDEGEYALTLRAMATETDLSSRQTGLLSEQIFDMEKLEPIMLNNPTNGVTIEGIDMKLNPPSLEWSSVEIPSSSELILSRRNSGLSYNSRSRGIEPLESDIYFSVESPSTEVQLPEIPAGTWYWTVIATTEDGFDITPLEPSVIRVTEIEPFAVPKTFQPMSGLIIDNDYLRQQRYIDFYWEEIDDADAYILSIMDEDENLVFEQVIADSDYYTFKDFQLLHRGTFTWTLEAIRYAFDNITIVQRGRKEESEIEMEIGSTSTSTKQTNSELFGR